MGTDRISPESKEKSSLGAPVSCFLSRKQPISFEWIDIAFQFPLSLKQMDEGASAKTETPSFHFVNTREEESH